MSVITGPFTVFMQKFDFGGFAPFHLSYLSFGTKKLKSYGFWGKLWHEKQNTLKTPWASKKRPLGQSQLKKKSTARIPQASSLCNALCMLGILKFPPCILSFRTYFGNIKRRFYVTSIQCLIFTETQVVFILPPST